MSRIALPSPEELEAWNSLEKDFPLKASSVSSVPFSTFVHLPSETFLDHVVFLNSGVSAAFNIKTIRSFDELIGRGNEFIYQIYSRRSYAYPLRPKVPATLPGKNISESAKKEYEQKIAKVAVPFFNEIRTFVQNLKTYCEEAATGLNNVFLDASQWSEGRYSDDLINSVCVLLFRLFILDELHLTKSAITNDFTIFQGYAKSVDQIDTPLRIWLSTPHSIEDSVFEKIKSADPALKNLVFNCFSEYIQNQIDKNQYIHPDMLFSYLRALTFLVRWATPDPKNSQVYNYLLKKADEHPLLHCIFEVSLDFAQVIKNAKAFKNTPSGNIKSINLDALREHLFSIMSDFPNALAKASTNQSEFIATVTKSLAILGQVKNAVIESYIQKIASPPPDDPANPYPIFYERALRRGYTPNELKTLLNLVTLWRSVHDLLKLNLVEIQKHLNNYVYTNFQKFVKNTLEAILCNSGSKVRDELLPHLDPIRNLAGDWEGENPAIPKKFKEHNIASKKNAPSLCTIELARIQLQHVINYVDPQKKKKQHNLEKGDVSKIQQFLDLSSNWIDLLQLDTLLTKLGDQSDLFFKESQLDSNKTIHFPVRASLPFILCEFALNNYASPELTEQIFYPLAIYNDAASVALRKLKAKFLLEEIKAESNICIRTLTAMISDFTFGAYRTFVSLRYISGDKLKKLKETFNKDWPQSRPYRIQELMKLNFFFLLGRQIDIRSLVVSHVENQIIQSITDLLGVAQKHGIPAMVAVTTGIEILQETHRLMSENGFSLLPFETLKAVSLGEVAPSSFASPFIFGLFKDFNKSIIGSWYMRSNPTRFSAPKSKQLPNNPWGVGVLGKILKTYLEPSAQIVTVDHLNSLVRLVDQGSIVFLLNIINSQFKEIASKFVVQYTSLKSKLERISDGSITQSPGVLFDRFEGAYRFAVTDEDTRNLFRKMKSLGNILGIVSLFDVAMAMNQLKRAQVIGFLRSMDLGGEYLDELFKLFKSDNTVLSEILKDNVVIPTSQDVHPSFLSVLIATLMKVCSDNEAALAETSLTVLQFETLKGFASSWSVLEYVFCLRDVMKNQTSFEDFGEGVMLFAGAMLAICDQENLHFATNIGRKLVNAKNNDPSYDDVRYSRFCSVYELASNSLTWAISLVKPIIKHITENAPPITAVDFD